MNCTNIAGFSIK